jgi:F0F1-type ATP synthase membrane subunit b/b'
MLNDVRNEVADLSVAIAAKVIGQAMDERRQRCRAGRDVP